MNILPKKRWHVRTKDNIARVRKDEAEAARLEEEKQRKVLLAEREARINFLRKSSKHSPNSTISIPSDVEHKINDNGHVNLFGDSFDSSTVKKDNTEYVKEKKEEKEKYEKQIGYLTYLGQDTNEALKLKSWYEIDPEKRKQDFESKKNKYKRSGDPIELFSHLKTKDKSKSQIDDGPSSSKIIKIDKEKKEKGKKKTIEELRAERLQREKAERIRQEMLLKKLRPEETITKDTTSSAAPIVKQKYNNQFNPMLARQNFMD